MIDKQLLNDMLLNVARVLKDNEKELCVLDSDIGDGDHGVAMSKIARIIEKNCIDNTDSIKKCLDDIGLDIMSTVGGSSGMLWGSFFTGFSMNAPDKDTESISDEQFKMMFNSAYEEMAIVTQAKVGDKTMMDAMIPAFNVIEESSGSYAVMLSEAAVAAREGANKTKEYVAKYGRAKNLHERAIGLIDAGAISTALVFEEMARVANKNI